MKNSIAIVALVSNTSAIQLKDQFVNLSQGVNTGMPEELGILGDTGAMPSELGFGAPAPGSELDELGIGPPPQPEGSSMKNV